MTSLSVLLFVQKGCPACEAAQPIFEQWMAEHPYQIALVLDAAGGFPARYGLTIKATPTYALVIRNEVIATVDGVLSAKKLDKWVSSAEKALALA